MADGFKLHQPPGCLPAGVWKCVCVRACGGSGGWVSVCLCVCVFKNTYSSKVRTVMGEEESLAAPHNFEGLLEG